VNTEDNPLINTNEDGSPAPIATVMLLEALALVLSRNILV